MTDWLDRLRAWLPKTASLRAYAMAALLVGFGIILRYPMEAAADQPLPPYITLYLAIVLSAFAGGIRVGMFALVISAIAAWTFWISFPTFSVMSTTRLITGAAYLITGTMTVLACGIARLMFDRLALSDERHQQVSREAIHRIKNLLAVTQSLSRAAAAKAKDVKSYRDQLDTSLAALATAQDMLLRHDAQDVPVHDLVVATLGPFLSDKGLELKLESKGAVPRSAVAALSMALYELATNSLKYGALASPSGFARVHTYDHEGRSCLDWREVGLAQIAIGVGAGLGQSLIRSALNDIEGASVRYDVSPQAVTCLFEWPLTIPQ